MDYNNKIIAIIGKNNIYNNFVCDKITIKCKIFKIYNFCQHTFTVREINNISNTTIIIIFENIKDYLKLASIFHYNIISRYTTKKDIIKICRSFGFNNKIFLHFFKKLKICHDILLTQESELYEISNINTYKLLTPQ